METLLNKPHSKENHSEINQGTRHWHRTTDQWNRWARPKSQGVSRHFATGDSLKPLEGQIWPAGCMFDTPVIRLRDDKRTASDHRQQTRLPCRGMQSRGLRCVSPLHFCRNKQELFGLSVEAGVVIMITICRCF